MEPKLLDMTKRIRKLVQRTQHKPAGSIPLTSPDDVANPTVPPLHPDSRLSSLGALNAPPSARRLPPTPPRRSAYNPHQSATLIPALNSEVSAPSTPPPVSEATDDDSNTKVQLAEERAYNTVAQYASLDVLRVIFEYAHHGTCHGKARGTLALNLTHVTSSWRHAALSTSVLWSTVVLDEGQPGCRNLVQMSLERVSPMELLDVVITLRHLLKNIGGPPALEAVCQVAHQWKSITLYSKDALNKLDHIVRVMDEDRLSNLVTIRLMNYGHPNDVVTAIRSPPDTHVITDSLVTSFLCRNLTSLDLGEGFRVGYQLPQLLTNLNMDSPSLSRLALGTRWPCWLTGPTAPLTWNSLTLLQIPLLSSSLSGVWIYRSAPALTWLELGSLNERGWSSFLLNIRQSGYVFHHVTELRLFDARFEASTPQEKRPYRRSSFFGAVLTTGSSKRATNALPSRLPSIFTPMVLPVGLEDDHDSLSQRDLPAAVEAVPGLHAAMPALVSLELDGVPPNRLLLWLRSMSGRVGTVGVCHWPELRNVTLRGSAVRDLKPVVLVALAEARRAAGRPLDRIQIDGGWSQGSPTKVLQRLRSMVTVETAE
jgi:hypothetical protein